MKRRTLFLTLMLAMVLALPATVLAFDGGPSVDVSVTAVDDTPIADVAAPVVTPLEAVTGHDDSAPGIGAASTHSAPDGACPVQCEVSEGFTGCDLSMTEAAPPTLTLTSSTYNSPVDHRKEVTGIGVYAAVEAASCSLGGPKGTTGATDYIHAPRNGNSATHLNWYTGLTWA